MMPDRYPGTNNREINTDCRYTGKTQEQTHRQMTKSKRQRLTLSTDWGDEKTRNRCVGRQGNSGDY